MGVPKFYRWISERYPCLSEVVKEHQVPEFDNLYLDMNGIIHNCSHPNDDDPHFRITEEQIFSDIFRYIEVLFRIIRPRKTFFMAVDGVAPRAKMNQQRGRRFRSAKDAEERDKIAVMKGEILPTEKRFDSNCITPGTKFMEKLQTQLEYFVKSKMTHDRSWQDVQVYLSGHQTPGEGEHKITEFIRYQRSQPGYDPNTRHCLYGLDADLMMLALCSHEPHFALLREEVRFTKRKNDKRTGKAEETTFHLLHISLMREYIDHEFEALKPSLSFPYNLESIIDDWVLMGFLVGNDFIPHLPNLHIASNALPLLYQTYIHVLPKLDGYINENGVINLKRFQLYLETLSSFDENHFEEIYEDYKWLESRRSSSKKLESGTENNQAKSQSEEKSIQIVKDLAISQGIYSDNNSDEEAEDDMEPFYREFKHYKRSYYADKFHVTPSNDQIQCIAFEYILGIQWICHYYYNGVQSWGWYYPYHYSPFVSDLLKVSEMKLKYKMNKPFLPYQQLLAVLPAASKDCIPEAYWHLMDEDSSEIGDFYPTQFSTDLNGKKQEWEAVVLIPFIDEGRLLAAMEPCVKRLAKEERARNQHGPCQLYVYDRKSSYYLKSTLPGVFPDIANCCASRKNIPLYSWSKLPLTSLIKGLLPECDLSVYYQGFPTLYHLPHTVTIRKQAVKVFQAPSRNENMILQIQNCQDVENEANYAGAMIADEPLEETAQRLLGKSVFVNWPHMEEAKVVAVSNGTSKFCLDEQVTKAQGSRHQFVREELTDSDQNEYFSELQGIKERAMGRRGIDMGQTPVLLYAQILLGCKYVCGSRGEITLEKQWSTLPQAYPIQATVKDLSVKGPTFETMRSVFDLFPKNAEVFHLSFPYYGYLGTIVRVKNGLTVVKLSIQKEPDLGAVIEESNRYSFYNPGFRAAKTVGISPYLFSRLTGSIYVYFPSQQKWNIGLNLKFTKENCGIAGFTKRKDNTWFFSNALIEVMQLYLQKYPEIFQYLGRVLSNNSEDMLKAEDIFESENTLEKLTQLAEFLKSLPCANGRKIHEKSNVVDKKTIEAVNAAVAQFKNSGPRTSLDLELAIRPTDLYRPMTQQGNLIPDKHAQHYLLDRVVNVRLGYTVPLGYRGTIVGIHMEGETKQDLMCDVLFDDEFLGGLTLGGQCPERRGYKLPACALINLSHGERIINRQNNRPVAVVKPHHQGQNMREVRTVLQRPAMNNHMARQQLVHSPYSAFSPTRRALFRPNEPSLYSTSSQRREDARNVRTVKTTRAETSSANFVKNSLRNVFTQATSQNKASSSNPVLLNEAAKKLPTVGDSSKPTSSSVRTVRVNSSSQQRGRLAIQTQLSLEEAKVKSSEKQPAEGGKGTPSKPKGTNTEQLLDALKGVLKINNKGGAQSDQQQDATEQLNKILSTLKVHVTSSAAAAKPFSLTDFLASNSGPTHGEMYPMYGSPTVLLRPEILKSPGNTSVVYSSNPGAPITSGQPERKEGAEKLWELLNISNEEEKLKERSSPVSPLTESDKKDKEHMTSNQEEESEQVKSEPNDGKDNLIEVSLEGGEQASSQPQGKSTPQADQLFIWCQQYGLQSPLYTYTNLQSKNSHHAAVQPSSLASAAYPSFTVRSVSTSIPAQHFTRDGKSVVPPQYVAPPSVLPFGAPHIPPPPVNFMPMTPDGMMMYRPPPMMPYHPYHMPQPGVMPPFVSSIAPPPQYVLPPASSPRYNFHQQAISSQMDGNSGRAVANSVPFIPSQVISQQFASKAANDAHVHNYNPTLPPQAPRTIAAPPPSTSSKTSSGKKPKGKLAISFAAPKSK